MACPSTPPPRVHVHFPSLSSRPLPRRSLRVMMMKKKRQKKKKKNKSNRKKRRDRFDIVLRALFGIPRRANEEQSVDSRTSAPIAKRRTMEQNNVRLSFLLPLCRRPPTTTTTRSSDARTT